MLPPGALEIIVGVLGVIGALVNINYNEKMKKLGQLEDKINATSERLAVLEASDLHERVEELKDDLKQFGEDVQTIKLSVGRIEQLILTIEKRG